MTRNSSRNILCILGIVIYMTANVIADDPRSHLLAPMTQTELKDRVNELVSLYRSGRDEATIELMSIYSSYVANELDYALNDEGSTARQIIGDILKEYYSRTSRKDIDTRSLFDMGRPAARGEQIDIDAIWGIFLQYIELNKNCTSWGDRDYGIMLGLISPLNNMLRYRSKKMEAREYIRVLTIMEWVYIASQRQELKERRSGMAACVAKNYDIAAMGTLSRFALAECDKELREMLWHMISMQQLELHTNNSLGRDYSALNREEMIEIVNSHYRDVEKAGGLNRIYNANAEPQDKKGHSLEVPVQQQNPSPSR